jgi:hypothetical protein
MAGESRDDRSDEQRRIRAIIKRAFKKAGVALPKSLADPAAVDDQPELARTPPPPGEPRKPVVTFLGTYELNRDAAMLVPPLDDDAVAALQETAFETEQRRMRMDEGQPNE